MYISSCNLPPGGQEERRTWKEEALDDYRRSRRSRIYLIHFFFFKCKEDWRKIS